MTLAPQGQRRPGYRLTVKVVAALALGLAAWLGAPAPAARAAGPDLAPQVPGVDNDYCLNCHGQPNQTRTLPSGELQYMTIDRYGFENSVHGQGGYACVQCHTTIREYPHPASTAQTLRDLALQNYTTCRGCHSGNYESQMDSVHQKALDAGNQNAAVCSDCHNPHYQTRLTNPVTHQLWPNARLAVPKTCARCHSAIYDRYKSSVHGAALLGGPGEAGGNTDVPTCIDCHGVHSVQDPTTTEFRLSSTELCAKCHTDSARMAPYGISTDVLSTYLADFHGTTVTLFQQTAPGQPTNKPVCYDCHGIHDIQRTDDPVKGLHIKQNLLVTCQKCHPQATLDFPDSWLSHYVPTAEKNPLVYWVNVFYQLLIPGVVGGMVVFVLADAGRRIYDRFRPGGVPK